MSSFGQASKKTIRKDMHWSSNLKALSPEGLSACLIAEDRLQMIAAVILTQFVKLSPALLLFLVARDPFSS